MLFLLPQQPSQLPVDLTLELHFHPVDHLISDSLLNIPKLAKIHYKKKADCYLWSHTMAQ